MDFHDTVVVEWRAITSDMEKKMDSMRKDAAKTRGALNGDGASGGSANTALRRRWALENSILAKQRAEKSVVYELAKGHRWLRGEALKTVHDQIAAAKKLHGERVAEAKQLTDIKHRDAALTDANNKLARSYREIAGDARKSSTDARLGAGVKLFERIKTSAFAITSIVRMVRYWMWIASDTFQFVGRIMSGVINIFVTLMRTWTTVVGTAVKLGAAVGVGVVGALALATKQAVSFESAMLRVGGVLSKRLDQMPRLERAVRSLAKTYGATLDEVSTGAFQLASFGYGQRQTEQMLPGVTVLARAAAAETGGTPDVNKAAEMTARSLLVYRMEATQAMRVSNALAAANAYSAATFERMNQALPKALQAATLANIGFEELVATLSQLMNVGMEGEQAGAAFFGMVQRLIRPTKEMESTFTPALARVGLTIRDINPSIVGFHTTLSNLEKVYRTSTEAQWAMLVATFRNRQGALALNAVVRQGVEEHDRMTRAVTGTRKAEEQSAILLDSVSAKWQRLKAAIRDLAITLTEQIRPPMKWLLDRVTAWVNWLASTPQVKALANALGGLAWGLSKIAVGLLYSINIQKNWKGFVQAVAGYMGRAVRITTVGFGLIEYAFRSVADPSSPLRKLWSSFWDFVVWSVELAGGGIAGAMRAASRLMKNIFDSMKDDAGEFGTAFITIMAEVARAAVGMPLRIMQQKHLQDAIAGHKEVVRQTQYAKDAAQGNEPGPVAIGHLVRAEAAKVVAGNNWLLSEYYRKKAEGLEDFDIQGLVEGWKGRIKGSIASALKGLSRVGGPLEGVASEYRAGFDDFSKMLRGEGGVGTPLTDALRDNLNALVAQWERTALDLRQRGDASAQVFEDGAKQISNLTNAIEEMDEEADGAADAVNQVAKAEDRVGGLIEKVIGAPLEAIQKFISPVSFGMRMGAGGLAGLLGLGRTNPAMQAAQMQQSAAQVQMQAANAQLQASVPGQAVSGPRGYGEISDAASPATRAAIARMLRGDGGAYAGGRESAMRSLAAHRGITQRRGTRTGFLPVQGDYFYPGTTNAPTRGPNEASAAIRAERERREAARARNFGMHTGGSLLPTPRKRNVDDFYWNLDERLQAAIGHERELRDALQNPVQYPKDAANWSALSILAAGGAGTGLGGPLVGAAGAIGAYDFGYSSRRDFRDQEMRSREMQLQKAEEATKFLRSTIGERDRSMSPLLGGGVGIQDLVRDRYGSDKNVHVYVHFDEDTLKPGVSKVVQQGVQQLIPALAGR